MSITSVMLSGTSGIVAAQTQISVASDNIANVNTKGYARKIANQVSVTSGGIGLGAKIESITRVADLFLQRASLNATSASSQSGVMSNMLDQAQALFGDPSDTTSFFGGLDKVYSTFSAASDSPTSSLSRNNAISAISDFINSATGISTSIKGLQTQANTQIGTDIDRANEILTQLAQSNTDITRTSVTSGDSSGSENIQSKLLNELSGLMSIQVSPRAAGGVVVRSSEGVQLVGEGGASSLAYDTSRGVGVITSTPPQGSPQTVVAGGGEIDGLLRMANTELPNMADQLSEFVTAAVDQLNTAHNASSSIPAPSTMTGRNTGLDLPTAVSGFTGSTRVAVVNAAGVVQRTVDIDFGANTMSVNGGAATSYGPAATFAANFLANLNTSLGGAATAAFSSSGSLSLAAGSPNGMVISDDPANPSAKVGQGFSQFFGMNDLVTSSTISDYDTGLKTTDAHGFTPGEVIKMQLTDSSGNLVRAVNVTVPAAGTMASLISAMNTGTSLYGSFALDANGRMNFTPAANQDVQVHVVSDDTHRGAGGPSISQMFGIGTDAKAARTATFAVRSDIALNSSLLAYGTFDRTTAVGGVPALAIGDGTGALALAKAGTTTANFAKSGDIRAMQTSVLAYASELSGSIGAKAATAATRKTSADAVSVEADTRRTGVEGVNLDVELVNLTTYQQAYNASARLITAAKDMYDTLLGILN